MTGNDQVLSFEDMITGERAGFTYDQSALIVEVHNDGSPNGDAPMSARLNPTQVMVLARWLFFKIGQDRSCRDRE